jgi:hypothetical protein
MGIQQNADAVVSAAAVPLKQHCCFGAWHFLTANLVLAF